jgi:uncharacterized membrane protein YczE
VPEDTRRSVKERADGADTRRVSVHPGSARPERSLSQLALSRADAIAELIATSRVRRVLGLSTRITMLLVGSTIIATAVAVTLWTKLGPGPLDVFIGAVRVHTGLPLSFAVWVVVGTLIAIAWLLGRRPGVGTIVGPLVVGVVMQSVSAVLANYDAPTSIVLRVAIHLLAIGAVGIGAGALIVSGLGAGSGELLASAASNRSGRKEPRVRLAFEVTWLVIGVAMGGPAGLGTILVALTIGWSVSNGHRIVDGTVGRGFQLFAKRSTDPRNGRLSSAPLVAASAS